MTRADRLNRIAAIIGARRYLEVGVCAGDTFFAVDVAEKVAVDPCFAFDHRPLGDGRTTFHLEASDAFFERHARGVFDLIYLDGLHTFDQTTRDFFNSLRFAHGRTVWVIDDTVPNDVFAALPDQALCYALRAQAGDPDESWMGDVFKTVFLIARAAPFLHYRTFAGHGQTVVWQGQAARPPAARCPDLQAIGTMGFVDMLQHREALEVRSADEIFETLTAVFAR